MTTTTATSDPPADYANQEVTYASHPLVDGVIATIELIDGPTARDWLTRNVKNRKIKKRHRAAILRDLRNNRWIIDGATVCFDTNNEMTDGQHRAECIEEYWFSTLAEGGTPQPVPSVVVRGLPPNARATTDSGAGRSPGDAAAISGEDWDDPYGVAGVAKQVYTWLNTSEGLAGSSSTQTTNQEVIATIVAHPELHEIVAWTKTMHKKYREQVPRIQPGIAAFCLWLFSYTSPETGRQFMTWIYNGTGQDSETSPVLVFRARMMSAKSQREEIGQLDIMIFLIRAWNTFQEGKPMERLQRPRGKQGPGTGHFTAADIPTVHHGPKRPDRPLAITPRKPGRGGTRSYGTANPPPSSLFSSE